MLTMFFIILKANKLTDVMGLADLMSLMNYQCGVSDIGRYRSAIRHGTSAEAAIINCANHSLASTYGGV